MLIENLKIGRIAIHEVFQREEDRKPLPPVYADLLEVWPDDAIDAFKARVTEALSVQAKSIEMQITASDGSSHVANANNLIRAKDDASFLRESRATTDRLVSAQMNRNIPGGILVVFDGTVGAKSLPFVGAIKAETQSGFQRREDAKNKIITEFLQNVFLTPATRLFKIAMFVEETKSKKLGLRWSAKTALDGAWREHRSRAARPWRRFPAAGLLRGFSGGHARFPTVGGRMGPDGAKFGEASWARPSRKRTGVLKLQVPIG